MTTDEFAQTNFRSGMTFTVDGVEMPLDAVDFENEALGTATAGVARLPEAYIRDDQSIYWYFVDRCTLNLKDSKP